MPIAGGHATGRSSRRAPVGDPGPGGWKKIFQDGWTEPGLGGEATSLGRGLGSSAARWTSNGETVLLGWSAGGPGLFSSRDHTTFAPLDQPLLALDPGVWKRPDPSEVAAYPVLLDGMTGRNQLSDHWLLVYAYRPPYSGRADKYLVFRGIEVSRSPGRSRIGVLLARWYDPALHDRWSTTAAVPGNGTSYRPDGRSGYLMTAADPDQPSLELEDCVSERPGHRDHLLAEKGFYAAHAYQRLRTAGWICQQPQPETIALYRCYYSREQSHFGSNAANREKLGTAERLLGYALAR